MELRINDRFVNRKIEFFNNFDFTLTYDAVASAFAFKFLFDPDNPEHKELACIGHYHTVQLIHNGELLLTGYLLSQNFKDKPVPEMTAFGGYSLGGVIEDCDIPPDLFPLQYDGLSLRQIAGKLLSKFPEVGMVVDGSVAAKMDEAFATTTATEGQSIKAYLTELATQKNIIISHDAKGRVLFTKAKANAKPVLDYENGGTPFTSMELTYNGQGMHSHITMMKDADADAGNAGEETIRNPLVPFVYRPKVLKQSSGTDNNTTDAAKQAVAAEIKGGVKLTIETDRWMVGDKILRPGAIINARNPRVYLYNKTRWFVEAIQFKGTHELTTAYVNCVLPSVYDGSTPVYPWKGINLHAK